MTELEKLNAGLPYNFMDPEVDALRLNAVRGCEELNASVPPTIKPARP